MRKKYIADYTVVEDGGKKRVEYRGVLYRTDMPPQALRTAKIMTLSAVFCMAAAYIGMGLTAADGTRALYVGIPYLLLVIPVAFACSDAVSWAMRGDMERIHYKDRFLRLMDWAVAVIVLSAAAFIGDTVYLTRTQPSSSNEYLFIPLSALLMLASWFAHKTLRGVRAKIVEIDAPGGST